MVVQTEICDSFSIAQWKKRKKKKVFAQTNIAIVLTIQDASGVLLIYEILT